MKNPLKEIEIEKYLGVYHGCINKDLIKTDKEVVAGDRVYYADLDLILHEDGWKIMTNNLNHYLDVDSIKDVVFKKL